MADSEQVSARLAQLLLLLAVLGLCGTLWFWYLAAQRSRLTAADLTVEERQALVRELVEISPGILRSAYFEPRIGYTLRPGEEHSVWNSTFVANELGYRTHPVVKPEGTTRIVFVGDSWTFGMWVSEEESFPARLEELVDQRAGAPRPVQAWNLALPGYNAFNEIAALETFFHRLRPDAVVLALTINDVDSSLSVLPDGSLGRPRHRGDGFGDPWLLNYRGGVTNSFLYLRRWERVMQAIAAVERRLGERSIPLLVFFAGIWDERFAHRLIAESSIDSPYLVMPAELTTREWLNPPPMFHATAEANRLLARLVYRGLQPRLGWAPLDESVQTVTAAVRRRSELDEDAVSAGAEALAQHTRKQVLAQFRPGGDPKTRGQCLAGVDPLNGLAGRHAALLLRREEGYDRLRIALGRIEEGGSLYPMEVRVRIPSVGGGSGARMRFVGGGPDEQLLALPIPEDVAVGSAFEVIFTAPRAMVTDDSLLARAFYLLRIEPLQ